MKTLALLLRALGLGSRRPRERRRVVGTPGEGGARAVRVLFAVESLEPGRATRALLTLLEGLDRRHFVPVVAARAGTGGLAAELGRLGVATRPLGPGFAVAEDVDLLCTWGLAPGLEELASLDLPWIHVACGSLACLDKTALRTAAGALREADAWIATSPTIAECARRRLRVPLGRIQLLPAGVSPGAQGSPVARAEARGALEIAAEARVFLSVGDFRPSTGHRLAIEALGRLTGQQPLAQLICAGDPADSRYLESCRQAAVARQLPVRFVALDSAEGLQRLHAASDFFVQPLGIDGLRGETLCALASGLPVLAPATVDARELFGEKPFALLFHDLADWPKAGPKACAQLETAPAAFSSPLAGAMRAALRSGAALAQAAPAGRELVEQSHGSEAVARCFEGALFALARTSS